MMLRNEKPIRDPTSGSRSWKLEDPHAAEEQRGADQGADQSATKMPTPTAPKQTPTMYRCRSWNLDSRPANGCVGRARPREPVMGSGPLLTDESPIEQMIHAQDRFVRPDPSATPRPRVGAQDRRDGDEDQGAHGQGGEKFAQHGGSPNQMTQAPGHGEGEVPLGASVTDCQTSGRLRAPIIATAGFFTKSLTFVGSPKPQSDPLRVDRWRSVRLGLRPLTVEESTLRDPHGALSRSTTDEKSRR